MSLKADPILNIHAALGEGSLWDADKQLLYWVSIMGKQVFIYDPATGKNTAYNVPDDVGTVVKRSSGGLVLALGRGFSHLDLNTGAVTLLAQAEPDGNGNRMNDGKCDPAGRLFAGTMGYKFSQGAGNLWRLDADHSVHHMLDQITCSNGLVWTSDKKTMYYIDTPTRKVDALDYDLATGNITNRRPVIEVEKGFGSLDGMTIDAEDKLWIAVWGAGMIARFDPLTGKMLDRVEVPGAKKSSSCAFGGPDLQDLYITTAAAGTNPIDEPNAGALFRVRIPYTHGVKAFEYAG